MKRVLIFGVALTFMLASCASKKHCDAYGNKSGSINKQEQAV